MIEWVKEIAIFLTVSGLILEMIAETKYYKFARWVAGVVLILQLLKPMVETQNLWEQFQATLWSFDYALGSEKVLEELYSVSDHATKSVLDHYKESISLQVEKILNRHEISLLYTEMEIGEDGALQHLYVCGEYLTEEKNSSIRIPTVVPVEPVDITKKERTEEISSPMEVYLCEVLAEFYRMEEKNIEVVIQEASE